MEQYDDNYRPKLQGSYSSPASIFCVEQQQPSVARCSRPEPLITRLPDRPVDRLDVPVVEALDPDNNVPFVHVDDAADSGVVNPHDITSSHILSVNENAKQNVKSLPFYDQTSDYNNSAISDAITAITKTNKIMVCNIEHRAEVSQHTARKVLQLALDFLQDIGMSVKDRWGQKRRYLPKKASLVAFIAFTDIYLAESTEKERVTSSAIRKCVKCGIFDVTELSKDHPSIHAETNLLYCLRDRCSEGGDVPVTIMLSHSPCDNCTANILNFKSNFPQVKFHIRYSLLYKNGGKSIALLAENGVDISPISAREREMLIEAMDKVYNAKPSHTEIEQRKKRDRFNEEQYCEIMSRSTGS